MSTDLTLSRARVRYRRARGFSAPYIVHQLVADMFPESEERRYLYRVTSRAPGEAQVLTLSSVPPRAETPERPWGTSTDVETRPYDPDLTRGMPVDYEIRINATRVVTAADGTKKRKDIWDAVFEADRDDPRSPHDVYRAYIERKLAAVASVREARVTERGQVRARRPDRRPILFIATNLIGTLEVTDPSGLLALMGMGIGRAKSFGCGLLCLSRPGTVLARRYAADDVL